MRKLEQTGKFKEFWSNCWIRWTVLSKMWMSRWLCQLTDMILWILPCWDLEDLIEKSNSHSQTGDKRDLSSKLSHPRWIFPKMLILSYMWVDPIKLVLLISPVFAKKQEWRPFERIDTWSPSKISTKPIRQWSRELRRTSTSTNEVMKNKILKKI